MMQIVRLLPVILSGVLVGAHFLRNQQWLAVAITVAVLGLLLLRRKWVVYLAQAGLVLASLEWVGTGMQLVQYRQSMGLPWTRLALILGGVALFTLLAALVFRLPLLRRRYGFIDSQADG
ncbi:MAG: hypothetical protein OEV73_00570 [Desulfobulbaceae bacterium]|nr:hypothetical protein [Desulfobulbaceae bacterium]